MCSTCSSIMGSCVVGCRRSCSKCGWLSPVSIRCGMIRIRPMSYSEREKTLDRLRMKSAARARCSSVRSSGSPSIRHWMWLCGSSASGLSVGKAVSITAGVLTTEISAPAAVELVLTVVALGVESGPHPIVDGESVDTGVPADTDNILMSLLLTRHSSCSPSPGFGTYSTGSARAK